MGFRLNNLISLYLLFIHLYCFSQSKTIDGEYLLDENFLESLSYDQLLAMEDNLYEDDKNLLLVEICEFHVKKAKDDNNNLELARGFYYLTIVNHFQEAYKYSDSIIQATMNSNHKAYPTLGYIRKGQLKYDTGDFEGSLAHFIDAYNIALAKDNKEDLRFINQSIAGIRNINGQSHVAANLYRRSLDMIDEDDMIKESVYGEYISIIYNLSLTHMRLKQLDSAHFYLRKGIDLSKEKNDPEFYNYFISAYSQYDYFNNNYHRTRDSLIKYIDNFEGTDRAINHFYLGSVEGKLGNRNEEIIQFKKIDSILEITDDPFDEVKQVYYELISDSKLNDDRLKQIYYIDKLLFYDSILSQQKNSVDNTLAVAYDIPLLKSEKQNAIDQINEKKKQNLYLISFSLIAIGSMVYLVYRNYKTRQIIDELINGPTKTISDNRKKVYINLNIPEDIQNSILSQLNRFEENKSFLNKKIDLASLASEFETNTSYLSMMVNNYKGVNFPKYLKDLRIEYAVESLSNDKSLLKYNYQGLADIFGFKTADSFSKAFVQKTGIYPSNLIKRLKLKFADDL